MDGELLLRQLLIQSIDRYLKNRNQNSLDTRSLYAIFHKVPEVDNCAYINQTQLQVKAT